MANYVGDVTWGIVPLDGSTSNLATMSWDYRGNYIISANDQIRYQVQWQYSGLEEDTEVGIEGGIVNVIFKIESSIDDSNWETLARIKKSRDVPNRQFEDGDVAGLHRFTIDISQLFADQLSYSLCPINKGTWQSNYYGGMNGGIAKQDNVIGHHSSSGNPISLYVDTKNGTFRRVRVSATFDILDANQNIITADDELTAPAANIITCLNSVNQFEKDSTYYFQYDVDGYDGKQFLTRCPNKNDVYTGEQPQFKKPVRIDEQAEWLQFYIRRGIHYDITTGTGSSGDQVCAMGVEINTYKTGGVPYSTFYLNDFQKNLKVGEYSGMAIIAQDQFTNCIQNISPHFINHTAALKKMQDPVDRTGTVEDNWSTYTGAKIDSDVVYYTAHLVKVSLYSPYIAKQITDEYFYNIDRESEKIPFGFVRFHWLNSMGGTDSYTAKRDTVEGLTVSRNVIQTKSADRTWYQADSYAVSGSETPASSSGSAYISNTMRGGNIYKGGREISGVDAERVQSVYTEPLNNSVAKWLQEIFLTTNVWVEKDTEATRKGNEANPYQRPSTKEYIPIIITNNDIETVNESEGLVTFNIEYTLAHKVQTQRN
tara:strand:+ start:317 stop:2107 length:1791 start_codon:yes stop_codon:yes gene_type:complete